MAGHKTCLQAPSTNHKSKRKRKPGNEKYLEFPTLLMLCIETNSILLTKTGTEPLCTIIILYFRSQPCFLVTPTIHLKTLQRKRSFSFSSAIRIYTCVSQTRYRVIGIHSQPTQVMNLWHYLGIGNVHFTALFYLCFFVQYCTP